nr:uncharacterized protein LOC104120445 [Nicotiana tomentosiformis]
MFCGGVAVARMPDEVPRLNESVKGIVLQKPYFERAWREISKGRWEARSHSLPKDVAMGPTSGYEDILPEPSALRQDKEKKRKRASNSLCSEKKKPRRRLVEDSAPKDALGVIDISESPSFTDSMINEAQTLKGHLSEGPQGVADSLNNFFDGLDSTASEDVIGLGDLPVPKKRPSLGANRPSSSLKLVNQFQAPSADPDRKWSIIMSIPKESRVLSAPVGVASYLFLVTEEDQAKMDEASMLHHKTFLQYREELNHHEAETRELTGKRDANKLLSEKLHTELEVARKEHAELVEQNEQLQVEVDTVKAEAVEWKKNMDRLASENETARAQLASGEVQLRAAKEKALVQAKNIEEL